MSANEAPRAQPHRPGGGHAGAWSPGEGPNVSRSERQRRLSVDARGIWSKLLRVGANLHGESGKGSAAVVRFSSSTCVALSVSSSSTLIPDYDAGKAPLPT
jgi:hypothetical protein